MWRYDDILIKVISHSVGTVIKNITTPSGLITPPLQYTKKGTGKKRQKERGEIEKKRTAKSKVLTDPVS